MIALVLASVLLQAEPSRPDTLELELFPVVIGEFDLVYHRAASRFVAFGLRSGFRAGPTGTMLNTVNPSAGWRLMGGAGGRFYPLGRAPTQLFIELTVSATVERIQQNPPTVEYAVQNAASLGAGWAFRLFDWWILSLRAGVMVGSFAAYSEGPAYFGGALPVVPLLSVSTGLTW